MADTKIHLHEKRLSRATHVFLDEQDKWISIFYGHKNGICGINYGFACSYDEYVQKWGRLPDPALFEFYEACSDLFYEDFQETVSKANPVPFVDKVTNLWLTSMRIYEDQRNGCYSGMTYEQLTQEGV